MVVPLPCHVTRSPGRQTVSAGLHTTLSKNAPSIWGSHPERQLPVNTECVTQSSHRQKLKIPSPVRYCPTLARIDGEWTCKADFGTETWAAVDIVHAAQMTYKVASSSHELFVLKSAADLPEGTIESDKLGMWLICTVRKPLNELEAAFPQCELNPLFSVLKRAQHNHARSMCDLSSWDGLNALQGFSSSTVVVYRALQAVVEELRGRWRSGEITQAMEVVRRRLDMQSSAIRAALREAVRDYSKLMVIRLDLRFLAPEPESEISKQGATVCLQKFQRHLNEKYPLVRFVRCIDHGAESGYSFRFLILLNAYSAGDGRSQGANMGEHWRSVITGGKGAYFCFNGEGRRGLGDIRSRDGPRVSALIEKEVGLLVEPGFWIRYNGTRQSVQISPKSRIEPG